MNMEKMGTLPNLYKLLAQYITEIQKPHMQKNDVLMQHKSKTIQ